jgi:UV DNA damage endonuclease
VIRIGLCCVFLKAPIKFRRTTATQLLKLDHPARMRLLSEIVLHNAESLLAALTFCRDHGIGAFRINSQILPLKTHPAVGYRIEDLPQSAKIVAAFKTCGRFSRRFDIRTGFHPDQFVVLNSPHPEVLRNSLAELRYQAEVARWVNADVINLHGGGAYGDKPKALRSLAATIRRLPDDVLRRLTLENDDRVFTPQDLLTICRDLKVPLVYDVHHHRCLPDNRDVAETTQAALATWNREPLFHLSSPLHGWSVGPYRAHHDFIDPADFPSLWRKLAITVEVEAKAKELAVIRLQQELTRSGSNLRKTTPILDPPGN